MYCECIVGVNCECTVSVSVLFTQCFIIYECIQHCECTVSVGVL